MVIDLKPAQHRLAMLDQRLFVTITLVAWTKPKLGAGPSLVAAMVAQTALGLVLDHFGLLGLKRSPITWVKAVGLVTMIAGTEMIAIR